VEYNTSGSFTDRGTMRVLMVIILDLLLVLQIRSTLMIILLTLLYVAGPLYAVYVPFTSTYFMDLLVTIVS